MPVCLPGTHLAVPLAAQRAPYRSHGAVGYTDTHDIVLYYKLSLALAARYGCEA